MSPRDEALHLMWGEGWANRSGGDIESHTGAFAAVSNYENELHELGQVFEDDLQTLGVEPAQLLGHFLLHHAQDDQRLVAEFPDAQQLDAAFELFNLFYRREVQLRERGRL